MYFSHFHNYYRIKTLICNETYQHHHYRHVILIFYLYKNDHLHQIANRVGESK